MIRHNLKFAKNRKITHYLIHFLNNSHPTLIKFHLRPQQNITNQCDDNPEGFLSLILKIIPPLCLETNDICLPKLEQVSDPDLLYPWFRALTFQDRNKFLFICRNRKLSKFAYPTWFQLLRNDWITIFFFLVPTKCMWCWLINLGFRFSVIAPCTLFSVFFVPLQELPILINRFLIIFERCRLFDFYQNTQALPSF